MNYFTSLFYGVLKKAKGDENFLSDKIKRMIDNKSIIKTVNTAS